MGRWSSSQLRGGGGAVTIATVATLFVDEGTGIFWDFTGPQPINWLIEESTSGPDGPWALFDAQPGNELTRNDVTDANFYRVTPADADVDPVGAPSNVVQYFA